MQWSSMHQIVTHRCCGHDVPRLADLQVIETTEKSQEINRVQDVR